MDSSQVRLTRLYHSVWHIKEYDSISDIDNHSWLNDSYIKYISEDAAKITSMVMGKWDRKDNSFYGWATYPKKDAKIWHRDNSGGLSCLILCVITDGDGTHIKIDNQVYVLKPWNLYLIGGNILHRTPYEPRIWRCLLRWSYWKSNPRDRLLESFNQKRITVINAHN